jgi:hypothetical protein
MFFFFFGGEGPRSRSYGRSLEGLLCNPVMKMIVFFFRFSKKWSTGGMKLTGKN